MDAAGIGVLCLASGAKQHQYLFKEIPCEIGGRGFEMHRLGLGDLYHVRVGKPSECSCECMGYLAHGVCKHLLGLQTLIEHGAI